MTKIIRPSGKLRGFGCTFVGALAWLMFGSPAHCLAANSGAALGVSVTIGPQLLVDGQGAAGSELVAGAAMPIDGIPFQIRVRSNAPWRWSARVESVSGLSAPLSCVYSYRPIDTFGGAPGGPRRVELGAVDGGLAGAPLPRGEIVLEGRVVAPRGGDPCVPWNAALTWTIAQVDVNAGRPLIWTSIARLRGGGTAAAVIAPAH